MSDNRPKTGATSPFGPDLERHGGRLELFDDGHIPETQRGDDSPRPRIVRYETDTDNTVHVYDGLLQKYSARMLYEATHKPEKCATVELQGQEEPWGTYVSQDEAVRWMEWKQQSEGMVLPEHDTSYADYVKCWKQSANRFSNSFDLDDKGDALEMEDIRHLLAVETVATFFLETIPKRTGTACVARDDDKDAEKLFSDSEFRSKAHGVAVWALSSTVGNAVQYHIDYAELLRYEENVIVPPLWAGTCQVSSLRSCNTTKSQLECREMQGGEFCVNLRGLSHYSDHGYKGSKSGDPMGGWKRPSLDGRRDCGVHVSEDSWVTIPYAHCRGIAHCGELPHLSSPIESIDGDCSRVIIGFNVFGHDVGHLVSKAPEHSKAFRRKVKLYRSTLATPTSHANGMDLSQIRNNKGLTKLLVLAKREKIKAELRISQERLTRCVWERLLSQDVVTVSAIVSELSRASEWPRKNDVHAHVNHMIYSDPEYSDMRSGKRYRIVFGFAGKENKPTRGSLVSLSASLSAVEV